MKTFIGMLSAITLVAVIGCSKHEDEGAAERAGKQVDEMGKAIEKAGEDMQK